MKKGAKLYFIAIIPPQEICREVTAFKEEIATRFLSKRALKVLPHITLKAPFDAGRDQQEDMVTWFNLLKIATPSFTQQLKNFGTFNNKRNPVIFVEPLMNMSLKNLQKEILLHYVDRYPAVGVLKLEVDFKPHMTIAYRDLQPAMFREAWKEFSTRTYQAQFTVNEIHLLQHDSKQWNILSTLPLNNQFSN